MKGWWSHEWSQDGKDLNVTYSSGGRNTMSTNVSVHRSYNPSGVQIGEKQVKVSAGEDKYGRDWNTIIEILSGWHGTIKPDSNIGNKTILFPGSDINHGIFSRQINGTINYEYNEGVYLSGFNGNEEFSGHISTQAGYFNYSGSAIVNYTIMGGEIAWTKRFRTNKLL